MRKEETVMEERIRRCFYEEGLSFAEIMKMYKVSYETVLKEIRKGPID